MNTYKDKYPEELTKSREEIEMQFVMTLWKNPEFYGDYEGQVDVRKDLLTSDGLFYYSLGKQLYNLNFKVFDEVTIFTHIKDSEALIDGFNRRGGMREINQMRAILNEENIESYFDQLCKNNMLMKLHDKGFNVLSEIKKFEKMTTSQLYDYFEYQLDNTFLNRGSGVKIEDLDITDNFLQDCHDGVAKGLSYGKYAPTLNYHTLGIHRSNVQIFAGFSGSGKSSFAIGIYVMSILDQDEGITIIANEMNLNAWRHILLITVLQMKFGYYKVTRKKLKTGNFTDEEWEMLRKGQEYINTEYKDKLKFAKIYDYSTNDVKRIIRKQAKLGYNYALYDTFKAENAASAQVTGELIEASKQLLQVAEKEDVGIIITMQLAIYMENTRYLTAQTLSNAKGVKEVVSELVLMRDLWEDEYQGEKYDVKPYKLVKNPLTGKRDGTREEIILDRDKRYKIVFLDKTRNDDGNVCVLFEFEGNWNKWKEIGYCNPIQQRT